LRVTGFLHQQRLDAVLDVIRQRSTRSLLDLGCGDGDLLVAIAREGRVERIVGVDLCARSLARLRARLAAEEPARSEVELLHASLLDAPDRLRGFDCAVLVETIEHLDAGQLGAFERTILGRLRPQTLVVTTPNAEFNVLLGVPAHRFRHPDHRFEWDRARFRAWAYGVAGRHRYAVTCCDIAGRHPQLGGASQMAVFDLASTETRVGANPGTAIL
jgi:3' terminal RNA ribose 2'-O-methyltransferase Hen1